MASMRAAVAMVALAFTAPVPVSHAAEVSNRSGTMIAAFDGGIEPNVLPRRKPAPVSVRVVGDVRPAPGSPVALPQLRRITVAINRQGRLFDRGLPVCRARSIQPATEAAARRTCGDAIVGHGRVTVEVRIPSQLPFAVHARLLAFNGPLHDGHRLIIAHVYAGKPPGSFVLVFTVRHRPGVFGTVLSTSLPPRARGWAYLTHFEMTLHRDFDYRGARRSFVSAACNAPLGFHSALFPFARATYGFLGAPSLSVSVAKTCYVA